MSGVLLLCFLFEPSSPFGHESRPLLRGTYGASNGGGLEDTEELRLGSRAVSKSVSPVIIDSSHHFGGIAGYYGVRWDILFSISSYFDTSAETTYLVE